MTTQTMGDMKSQGTSYWIPLMCTANVTDRPRAGANWNCSR